MSPQTLPITRLINVTETLSAQAAQSQNLNNLLILGSSPVIDVTSRMRSYASLDAVALDFSDSDPEYLGAVLWFEQAPQPTNLYIGRWANANTAGQLFGGPLTPAQQAISVWNAITTGGFHVTIDGVAKVITGLNFSAAGNLNAVAAIIQTALAIAEAGTTCVWDATYSRFEFTSGTTGASSSVSFVSAGAPTDISAMLLMTNTPGNGAYLAPGMVAESALAAVQIFDANFGQAWFGLVVLGAVDADHELIAPYIEGATTKHYYGVSTQEGGVIVASSTTDIAYILSLAGYTRTCVQYSSTSPYAVVSYLARILTTDYTGNNTVITLMYKQEPGIVPENLSVTQIDALEAKNCNVFVSYNNNTAIIEPGVSSSGDFTDSVIGALALSVDVATGLYNLLYQSTTKVPQTDAGVAMLTNRAASTCSGYAANGLLGPGKWTGTPFGSLNTGDLMGKGFYIYAGPISLQSEADRAARKSPLIQIAAKLQGAVHSANVAITVNA